MSENDDMTIDERRKYIHNMWGRYRDSSKVEKSLMPDQMEQITGMHRKSIIRINNGYLSRKKWSNQRWVTLWNKLSDSGVLSDVRLELLFNLRDQIVVLVLRERSVFNLSKLWHEKSSRNAIPVNVYHTQRKEKDKSSVTFLLTW